MANILPGLAVDERYAEQLRFKIKALLNCGQEKLIGAEPTCLLRNQLRILEEHDYLVSRKGTGRRSFLYLVMTPQGPGAFFVTSDNALYYNQMHFPIPTNYNMFHSDTLIDGEINITTVPGSPPTISYIAFDLVAIDGVSITQRSLTTRLGILQQDILKPHQQAHLANPHWHQPFTFDMTKHERSYGLGIILSAPSPIPITGLIFTPVKTPYTPQKSSLPAKLFCWTHADYNCCAFKLKVLWDKERKAHYQLMIADRMSHKYFDDFTPEPELLQTWRTAPPDGCIIDCKFDQNWDTLLWENGYAGTVRKGGWRFCRYRPDKTMADDEKILKARWKSYLEPLPLEALEEQVENIRSNWKLRERRGSNPALDAMPISTPIEPPKDTIPENDNQLKESPSKTTSAQVSSNPTVKDGTDPNIESEYEYEEEEEEEITFGYSGPAGKSANSESIHDPAESTDIDKKSSAALELDEPKRPKVIADVAVSIPEKLVTMVNQKHLQKNEQEFIPTMPNAAIIDPKIVPKKSEGDSDSESPLEDLLAERYATINRPKPEEPPRKKARWLDTILN